MAEKLGENVATGGRLKQKKRRAEVAVSGASDPFVYLMNKFQRCRDAEEKTSLAFQLLPYLKPKLRAVDIKGADAFRFVVSIGGDE
jgi:hypothetical protein